MSHPESTRRFHFIREIASGGFGSVYLAKVIHADGFSRLAAIKLLHPKWTEDEEITKRMRDEARLLGWLRHKHIVDVLDLTMIDGRCAVLMEYLEAVDVKVVINHCVEQGMTVPLRVALELCSAVASALDAAYNRPPFPGERPLRVVHRDIKPSNVMVDETGMVKVLDFGVARAEFDQREAKTQEMSFGSLEYMPPERLFFEPESAASDIYSLGATLFEMLALEKLGKAKLRQGEQEQFVEQRFDDLLMRHPLPGEEIEDILHDLLWDMLAFDEVDRPSAGDCVSRMRSFARRLKDEEGLEEWAERVIPPLVRRMQNEERTESDLALVDRVLTEDTVGFKNRIADEATAPPTDLNVPLPGEVPAPPASPRASGEHPTVARRVPRPKPPPQPQGRSAGPLSVDVFEDGAADEGGLTVPLSSTPYIRDENLNADIPAFPSVAPTQRQAAPPGPPPVPDGIEALRPYASKFDDDEGEPTVEFSNLLGRQADDQDATVVDRPPDAFMEQLRSRGGVPPDPSSAPKMPDLPPRPPQPPPSRPPAARSMPASVPPERGGRGKLWLVLGGLTLGGVALVAALMVLGLLGTLTVMGTDDLLPVPQPEPQVQPVLPLPAPAPAPEAPEVAEGEGVRFVSRLEGTRKMLVRCDEGQGSGVDAVVVAAQSPGTCTVTAIDGDRQRATAVLQDVEARTYICFEGGELACE